MSRLRRNIYSNKLNNLLQSAEDEAFFTMIWAIRTAQTGRPDRAKPFLDFPPQAATDEMGSEFAAHPWKCETLLNEVLTVPKLPQIPGRPNRILNCSSFGALATVMNVLRELENAEDGFTLKRVDVFKEIHRLSQRQFEWQRGFLSLANFYRSAFIYGGPLTRTFFEDAKGLTLSDFSLACFGLQAIYYHQPVVRRGGGLDSVGISEATLNKVYNLISIPHDQARQRAIEIRAGNGHTGYKRSPFREYPCIAFGSGGERLRAPLPALLMLRATTGVFYDVTKANGDVRNEIAGRFETYCIELLQHMLPSRAVRPSFKYRVRKNVIDSPDIVLSDESGAILVVFECKARRMSYEARFSEDPVAEARQAYEEVAKGVFQIWRFVSHHRRGLLGSERLVNDVRGVVVTLDTWLSAATSIHAEVFNLAKNMADKASEIIEADRISVTFCPITDLEYTLGTATEISFLEAIAAAAEPRFQGWMLSNVHEQVAPSVKQDNGYPFEDRLAEVWPWWKFMEERKALRTGKARTTGREVTTTAD
ncbi:MAG: hypothetical protein HY985_00405 [Magnetospirillum sp.]|nr:hypothetical protein [Magnetospirillum sp.]